MYHLVWSVPDAGLKLREHNPTLRAELSYAFPESEGDFISTGDIAHDRFVSELDGPPVVKTFDNMTINAGHTVTPTLRCKGMYLYVRGDLIVNGALSMNTRGAVGPGVYIGMDYRNRTVHYHPSDIFTEYGIPFIAPNGGAGTSLPANNTRVNGNPGKNNACGGGGSGGCHKNSATGNAGAGGNGTSFGGGAGGGGLSILGVTLSAQSGAANGGAGGYGRGNDNSGWVKSGGGGAGNPGGAGHGNGGGYGAGGSGTGGVIILFVDGRIIFGSSGIIRAQGSGGGYAQPSWSWDKCYGAGGGGSGGGAIHVFCPNDVDQTKFTVSGGPGYASNIPGGNGGAGSLTFTKPAL